MLKKIVDRESQEIRDENRGDNNKGNNSDEELKENMEKFRRSNSKGGWMQTM